MSALRLTKISFWLSLILFVFLLVLPTTGWLTRTQIGLCLHRPSLYLETFPLISNSDASHPDQLHAVALRFPHDYSLQMADVLLASKFNDRATSFRALKDRFSNSSSLYAHILCFAVGTQIHISRRDISPPIPKSSSGFPSTFPDTPPEIETRDLPGDLAEFDYEAQEGERLDPNNAFFPIMRAIGLFAADQDELAINAIQSAATKTHWNDYSAENVSREWRLEQLTFGKLNALAHLTLANTVSESQFIALSALARVATSKAVSLERAGNVNAGVALRHSLMRCASPIRADARFEYEFLEATHMVKTAMRSFGGSPSSKAFRSAQRYCDELEKAGYVRESKWVHQELAAEQQVQAIFHEADTHADFSNSNKHLMELNCDWMTGVVLLSDMIILFALLGVAAVLKRFNRILPCVGIIFAALISFGVVSFLAFWLMDGAASIAEMQFALFDAPSYEWYWNKLATMGLWHRLLLGFSLGLPILFLVVLCFVSVFRRIPIASGVVQFYCRTVVPTVGVLVLGYAGLCLVTLREETAFNRGIVQSQQHEGRYFAKLLGRSWPEAI